MLQEGMIPGNSILPPEAPSSCILASLPRALLIVHAPLWSPATTGFRQARGGPPQTRDPQQERPGQPLGPRDTAGQNPECTG